MSLDVLAESLLDLSGEVIDCLGIGIGVVVVEVLEIAYGYVEHDDCVILFCALILKTLSVLVVAVVNQFCSLTEVALHITADRDLVRLVSDKKVDGIAVHV